MMHALRRALSVTLFSLVLGEKGPYLYIFVILPHPHPPTKKDLHLFR